MEEPKVEEVVVEEDKGEVVEEVAVEAVPSHPDEPMDVL